MELGLLPVASSNQAAKGNIDGNFPAVDGGYLTINLRQLLLTPDTKQRARKT